MESIMSSIVKEEQDFTDLFTSAAERLTPLPLTGMRPGTARRVFQLAEEARALAKLVDPAPGRFVRMSEWVERAARFLKFKDPLRAAGDVLDEISPRDTYLSHPDDARQWDAAPNGVISQRV